MAGRSTKDSALLVIHVQNAFFEAPKPLYEAKTLIANVKHLIELAHLAQVPVIYLQDNATGDIEWMNSTPLRDIHPEIVPTSDDMVIQTWGQHAFEDTDLDDQLKSRGIKRLTIVGCQTEYCINNAVRSASALGYDVTLIKDAQGTSDSNASTAAQIVTQYCEALGTFATVRAATDVTFE